MNPRGPYYLAGFTVSYTDGLAKNIIPNYLHQDQVFVGSYLKFSIETSTAYTGLYRISSERSLKQKTEVFCVSESKEEHNNR